MRGHGVRDKWLGSEKMAIGLYRVQAGFEQQSCRCFLHLDLKQWDSVYHRVAR
jgi:hypothetical protein